MEKSWNTDTYNGNTDSASDLEAPCDLYPVVEVERRLQRMPSSGQEKNQGQINLSPHIIPQNSHSASYFQDSRMDENEYVNTANIIDQTPRKKPLLSLETLPENIYVNISNLQGRGRIMNSEIPSSVTRVEPSSNRPSCSSCSSSQSHRGSHMSSKTELLVSPNNNSDNIPSSSSIGSSKADVTGFLKGSRKDCATPCESKSAWQFRLQYGTEDNDMESSEETPSPCSDVSPDIVLSDGSIASLSDGVTSDSSENLAFRDADQICSPQSPNLTLLSDRSQIIPTKPQNTTAESCKNNNFTCMSSSKTVRESQTKNDNFGDTGGVSAPRNAGEKLNNLVILTSNTLSPNVGVNSINLIAPAGSSASAVDNDTMIDSPSDLCSSCSEPDLDALEQPVGAKCPTSRLLAPVQNREAAVINQKQLAPSYNCDQNHPLYKFRNPLKPLQMPGTSERFISLQDFSEPSHKCQGAASGTPLQGIPNRPHALLTSSDRFCCWQRSSEHLENNRRTNRRPLSLHELEVRPTFLAEENSSLRRCTCTSRQTQTENTKPGGLKQSNSFCAMPRSISWWGRRPDEHRESIKGGNKVNLGVSSLRSAYPVVRRQPSLRFPTSRTTENLKTANVLESSQSTPSFMGLCRPNCLAVRRGQRDMNASMETGWRYTRPVSDSGLLIKHANIGASKLNTHTHVPDFLKQISDAGNVSCVCSTSNTASSSNTASGSSKTKNSHKQQKSNGRKNFTRRLSDPSFSLPQPPRRSESLTGRVLLARSVSEPYIKNSNKHPPTDSGQPQERRTMADTSAVTAGVSENAGVIYENLPSRPQSRLVANHHESSSSSDKPAGQTEPSSACKDTSGVPKPFHSDAGTRFLDRLYRDGESSDSSDTNSSSDDCAMDDRPELCHLDSSDSDSDTEEASDSGDNYAESSEDSSDTISMDDLLGIVTAQDGDADDEDGFLATSDEEDEDELLLPLTAPSRMCDRPPSPYPNLGDSSDDEHLRPMSAPYEPRSRNSRDAARLETPEPGARRTSSTVQSRTEHDFLEFEILNPEDYGIEHPPSYMDLFPAGMSALPEMPPSYDDAIRPISIHQDHFDYASFQDQGISNRFSLQLPWVTTPDDYLANPPPAYDEAVYNVSGGRSPEELSYQSPLDSPVRRSRGRRILNGLRRFARKIFR